MIIQTGMRTDCILYHESSTVTGRKEGKWMYYSISPEGISAFRDMIGTYARCDCETQATEGCCFKTAK